MVEWPPSRAGNWGPQGVGKSVEVGIGPFQEEVPSEGNPEGYTATRKIGLPGLLMILLSWGDFSYPCGLITGLPTAGFAPNYGVFPFHAAPFLSCRLMKFLMERSPTMQISCIVCGRVRMMPLCWSSQGFCSQPVKKPELLHAVLKGQRFRLIPRCAVTQANSKQRIIDDAARGGQRSLSSDQSKLVLCTPLRPAQHIAAVASVMSEELWAHSCRSDTWLGAGEDWPQAYRRSPINFDESLACVVIFWHDEWQEPAFQVYSSLPALRLALNRYSRFAEALGRRLQRSFGMLKELLGKPSCETAAVG